MLGRTEPELAAPSMIAMARIAGMTMLAMLAMLITNWG